MLEKPSQPLLASVIVPTYNRKALLKELIESLWGQTLDPECYEVIVIDDCSTDGTLELLESMREYSPCRMVCQRTPSNKGPINARNIAARMARADILAFTDSDCRVAPDWLEKGTAALNARSDLAFVSGSVLDKPEQPVRFFSLPNGTKPGENPVYPTWNIFYRERIFRELGGFDESAWFGNVNGRPIDCSDSDFALKIKQMGYPFRFARDVIVYHEVWQASPLEWLRAFFRLIYVPALIKRHPSLRKDIVWWGPFVSQDNLFFYLGLLGAVLGLWSKVGFLLLLPHFWKSITSARLRVSLGRIPKLAGQILFLSLRQAVICASLLYGSLRMRTLVL
jgi:glycosyltransferase involved in cell wall biosynthesis